MQVRKILSIAIVSALLAACSSSSGGGGGNGIRPSGSSSLESVSPEHRSAVSAAKSWDLAYNENGYSGQLNIDGKTTGKYNFSDLPNGRTDNLPISEIIENPQGGTTNYSGKMMVYQQPYSVITGVTWTTGSGAEFEASHLNVFEGGETTGSCYAGLGPFKTD